MTHWGQIILVFQRKFKDKCFVGTTGGNKMAVWTSADVSKSVKLFLSITLSLFKVVCHAPEPSALAFFFPVCREFLLQSAAN